MQKSELSLIHTLLGQQMGGISTHTIQPTKDAFWMTYEGEKNSQSQSHGYGKYVWPDGSSYEGLWENGEFHGFGVYSWPDGDIYVGEWQRGERTGKGAFFASKGDVYEGDFVNGRRHGSGAQWHANGNKYLGDWIDGERHGKGFMFISNTKAYYDCQWVSGQVSGFGVFKMGSGDLYEGGFLNGNRHGDGVYSWADGTRIKAVWNNGVRDEDSVMELPSNKPNWNPPPAFVVSKPPVLEETQRKILSVAKTAPKKSAPQVRPAITAGAQRKGSASVVGAENDERIPPWKLKLLAQKKAKDDEKERGQNGSTVASGAASQPELLSGLSIESESQSHSETDVVENIVVTPEGTNEAAIVSIPTEEPADSATEIPQPAPQVETDLLDAERLLEAQMEMLQMELVQGREQADALRREGVVKDRDSLIESETSFTDALTSETPKIPPKPKPLPNKKPQPPPKPKPLPAPKPKKASSSELEEPAGLSTPPVSTESHPELPTADSNPEFQPIPVTQPPQEAQLGLQAVHVEPPADFPSSDSVPSEVEPLPATTAHPLSTVPKFEDPIISPRELMSSPRPPRPQHRPPQPPKSPPTAKLFEESEILEAASISVTEQLVAEIKQYRFEAEKIAAEIQKAIDFAMSDDSIPSDVMDDYLALSASTAPSNEVTPVVPNKFEEREPLEDIEDDYDGTVYEIPAIDAEAALNETFASVGIDLGEITSTSQDAMPGLEESELLEDPLLSEAIIDPLLDPSNDYSMLDSLPAPRVMSMNEVNDPNLRILADMLSGRPVEFDIPMDFIPEVPPVDDSGDSPLPEADISADEPIEPAEPEMRICFDCGNILFPGFDECDECGAIYVDPKSKQNAESEEPLPAPEPEAPKSKYLRSDRPRALFPGASPLVVLQPEAVPTAEETPSVPPPSVESGAGSTASLPARTQQRLPQWKMTRPQNAPPASVTPINTSAIAASQSTPLAESPRTPKTPKTPKSPKSDRKSSKKSEDGKKRKEKKSKK